MTVTGERRETPPRPEIIDSLIPAHGLRIKPAATSWVLHIMINHVRRAASLLGFAATILLGSFAGAQANIIDHGAYLSDTGTGLDWLDLTATQGRSYNDVLGSMPAGGWHYASLADVTTLFTDAGGTPPYNFSGNNGQAFLQGPATDLLLNLMGNTNVFSLPAGAGLTSDIDLAVGCCGPYPHFLAVYTDLPPTTDYLLVPFLELYPDQTADSVGSFLIRDSKVPEPVSLSLFGAGLAGALGLRRRAKKRA
jgi:hypothetical protein